MNREVHRVSRVRACSEAILEGIADRGSRLGAVDVDKEVDVLAEAFVRDREALITVLVSPEDVLREVRTWLDPSRSSKGEVDAWLCLVWLAEASWRAVCLDTNLGSDLAPGDRELLRPLAARLRFIALSEPWRHVDEDTGPWVVSQYDLDAVGIYGEYGVMFGHGTWSTYVARALDSRREWWGILNAYQSHAYLSRASSEDLDFDASILVFRSPKPRRFVGHRGGPLVISSKGLVRHEPIGAEDRHAIDAVTERYLLPRFHIAPVAQLALYSDRDYSTRRWGRMITAAGTLGFALAAAIAMCSGRARMGATLSLLAYGLMAGGSVGFGSRWAAPWLLRFPAASAVGLLALISFFPDSWLSAPPPGWWAISALLALSAGYLVVETRNHGASLRQAVTRSLVVFVIGWMHATMVSLVGFVFVAPAYIDKGAELREVLLSAPGWDHGSKLIALSAAWCLAVGVLSQVLWDDRPVTASLAHLTWRAPGPLS
jgi:hypothetical protein